jgi:hypothetical protein
LYIANAPYAPDSDPGTKISPLSPYLATTNKYDVNTAFNEVWNTYTELQPNVQRFIDLRVMTNEDGTMGPLFPGAISSPPDLASAVTNFTTTLSNGSVMNRCRIVPGSETVYGPDQAPGDHYGHPVRYTRVTGTPGLNQYRINYTDLPEPLDTTAATPTVDLLGYQSAFGLNTSDGMGFSPATYDPTNFVSAVLEPRYKVGYIQFDSDPAAPLPQGYYQATNTLVPVPFKIDYRFQLNGTLPAGSVAAGAGASDTFAVDYDTRQLMQVLLTLRTLPQSNMPNPQTVTLKATAQIKNVAH